VKYHSTQHLANLYFQIRVEPEYEKYNRIKTPLNLFGYEVMLQGDTNTLATAIQDIGYML
jgi:Zn-dependent membrane protease YugP